MEGLLSLAVLIERLVEFFVAPVFDANPKLPKVALRYIAAVVGIGICVASGLNALAFMPGLSTVSPLIGQVLTGLLVGGGATLLHEFLPNPPPNPGPVYRSVTAPDEGPRRLKR